MQNKGFTLIEVLIVIAIIAILGTLFINVSTISTKKARDASRMSSLKQYQNALELFANKNNGFYPSRGTTQASTTLCVTDLKLTGCSEDPKNSSDATFVYDYQSDGSGGGVIDGTQYVLWDKLEAITPTAYWVYCSNGKAGQVSPWAPPTGGICPLP